MKSLTEYLEFHTAKRRELINITSQVESLVKKRLIEFSLDEFSS